MALSTNALIADPSTNTRRPPLESFGTRLIPNIRLSQESDLIARFRAPATCGELMQGAIGGRDFLVNCPIDRYAQAAIYASETPGFHIRDGERFAKILTGLVLLDAAAACKASRATTRATPDKRGHELRLTSDIPRGKGMASSSADLAAALNVACEVRGVSIEPVDLSRLMAYIEPSDNVHLPGIAHVNHLDGTVNECLPAPDDLSVVIVDCGGEVDTLGFDRRHARNVYRSEQPRLIAAMALLKQGLRHRDPVAIARAATVSAEINQRILRKAPFEDLLHHTRALGALGVNCAHSGTVLGVLYRTSQGIGRTLSAAIERRFGSKLEILGNHRIIAGGCHDC